MDLGVEAALPTLEGNHGAKILSRPPSGGEASILIPETNLTAAIAHLRATGAQGTITTQKTDYVFTPENPLFAKLQAKLAGAAN